MFIPIIKYTRKVYFLPRFVWENDRILCIFEAFPFIELFWKLQQQEDKHKVLAKFLAHRRTQIDLTEREVVSMTHG